MKSKKSTKFGKYPYTFAKMKNGFELVFQNSNSFFIQPTSYSRANFRDTFTKHRKKLTLYKLSKVYMLDV